jgi:hypothetical protein
VTFTGAPGARSDAGRAVRRGVDRDRGRRIRLVHGDDAGGDRGGGQPRRAAGRDHAWLDLTAGQLFPRTVIYTSTAAGADWPAQLVGIAPKASCAAATDPQIGPSLARSGCRHPKGGYNIKIGFGLINPYGALLAAGKLARLSATASPAQVSSAAHFGSPPVAAEARHRSTAKIAVFAGIIAVGIMVLLVALVLAARRHRSAPVAVGPPTPRPRRHAAPF